MPTLRRQASFVLALALSAAPASLAAVLRVDASLNTGANDGSTWADAFQGRLGLAAAVAAAQPGDEIWIADGVYAPAGAGGSRAASFAPQAGVALLGGFAGGETSADQRDPSLHTAILTGDLNANDGPPANGFPTGAAENSFHVVRIDSGDGVVLDGLTIRAGNADNGAAQLERSGGNISIRAGAPTIRDCVIENGYAGWLGAGVCATDSSPQFIDCVFRANRADFAGSGAAVADQAVATFTNCDFTANYCGQGAGAYAGRVSFNSSAAIPGVATFTDCRFTSNIGVISSPSGGGILSRGGHVTAVGCVFLDNEVVGGGGACYLNGGTAFLDRCDFVNNSAPGDGGGAIYFDGGNGGAIVFESIPVVSNSRFVGNNGAILVGFDAVAQITNCTIANNSFGFGFLTWPTFFVGADEAATLSNTVVWGNNDQSLFGGSGAVLAGQGPYTLDRCIIQGWTTAMGGDATAADPLFRDADGPDNLVGTIDDQVLPRFGSPAIDAGINASVPAGATLDLAGLPRIIDADAALGGDGPVVDLGAHEHPCAPDVTADGLVNFADLNALLGAFGLPPAGPEDINEDGAVNFADLNILLSAFGGAC